MVVSTNALAKTLQLAQKWLLRLSTDPFFRRLLFTRLLELSCSSKAVIVMIDPLAFSLLVFFSQMTMAAPFREN